jgi:hypothetical protein
MGRALYPSRERYAMPVLGKTDSKSRVPEQSVLFEKIVPASLIALGIITAVLILFAAGVLLGLIRF